MPRLKLRIQVLDNGGLEVIDPGFDTLPLLQAVNPEFKITQAALPGFSSPRFLLLGQNGCSYSLAQIKTEEETSLWKLHERLMVRVGQHSDSLPTKGKGEASILDLKIELARRILSDCRFCGNRCHVNRLDGELGICGLGAEALVAESFVHIAEEPPINPSLIISLNGCGLQCRFCQQSDKLNPDTFSGGNLTNEYWNHLNFSGARSLSFLGGNPDESLHGVLNFLNSAPSKWTLPIVWNSNSYSSDETLTLLDGVIDAYVPDFKFWDIRCAQTWTKAQNYVFRAKKSLSQMVDHGVPVLVRILVLPGHMDCCHKPTIEFLASLEATNISISIRDQYRPDHLIVENDGSMSQRPGTDEVESIRTYAKNSGLKIISS